MIQEKTRKVLVWLREYGVILLTVFIFLTSIQYCQHDYRLKTKIEPVVQYTTGQIDSIKLQIEANNKIIALNIIKIDSLTDEITRLRLVEQQIQKDIKTSAINQHKLINENLIRIDSLINEINEIKNK